MDSKTRSILIGALALIIIAVVLAIAMYAGRLTRNTDPEPQGDALSTLPVISISGTPLPSVTGAPTSSQQGISGKVHTGEGFTVSYPGNWGLLTCANSPHFELDPTNSNDVRGVVCDDAVKPVTVLVSSRSFSCQGDSITLGNNRVTKSRTVVGNDTYYEWCFSTAGQNFNVTHRVSASGSRATSTTDYAVQIEEMIGKVQPLPQGS